MSRGASVTLCRKVGGYDVIAVLAGTPGRQADLPVQMAICVRVAFCFGHPPHGQYAALRQAWPHTDFTRRGIDLAQVVSGGPANDGIPALTQFEFMSVAAKSRLSDPEPVMSVHLPGQQARAYSLRYLM